MRAVCKSPRCPGVVPRFERLFHPTRSLGSRAELFLLDFYLFHGHIFGTNAKFPVHQPIVHFFDPLSSHLIMCVKSTRVEGSRTAVCFRRNLSAVFTDSEETGLHKCDDKGAEVHRRLKKTAVKKSDADVPVPGQYLKLSAFKNVLPDIFTAGGKEAHLSAQRSTNDSKQAHHLFMKVHLSLCRHISSSVSCTKEQELRAWLTEGEMDRTPSVCPLLGASVREIWLRCQDTAAALSQVICQLENFVSCHQCPFPHVIRAGTIFIPMLVVKEVLFPDIPGELIDQVLQEHRIELRPTTLSEERHLMQLQKRTCSSKQRRLLSLRQLPDIYPDILNLFYLTCVKERL
ncbi:hypothetical protein Z043_106342, partial [Scleropages formosus]